MGQISFFEASTTTVDFYFTFVMSTTVINIHISRERHRYEYIL